MTCKKWHKKIHRLLDGDLAPDQEREVRAHMDTCPGCTEYHRNMSVIAKAMRTEDPEPPDTYRPGWKRALNSRRTTNRKKVRRGAFIPATACIAAAIIVGSTAVMNPQVFGLGGAQVQSEQGAVSPSPGSMEHAGGATLGTIVFGETVGTAESDTTSGFIPGAPAYSEATASSPAADSSELVAQGNLTTQDDNAGVSLLSDETVFDPANPPETTEAVFEVRLAEEAEALEIHQSAEQCEAIEIFDNEDSFRLDGPAAEIRSAFAGHSVELPENATSVLVTWEPDDASNPDEPEDAGGQ